VHLSQDEQGERFIQRIDGPRKNWKFKAADTRDRKFWPQYVSARQAGLNATSTADSTRYLTPADDRNNTRLILSQVVLDTFESLNLQHPIAGRSVREGLKAIPAQPNLDSSRS